MVGYCVCSNSYVCDHGVVKNSLPVQKMLTIITLNVIDLF